MKIAYVSDAIYPYNKGGKEKRLYDITTRLAKMGHDVHIYCMKWWPGPEKDRTENGVHLHAISPLYPLYSGERRSIKQALLFGISCLKLIKENWDVIDVDHMPFYPVIFTKIICVLKGKKMYATWHEVWGLKYWKKYLGVKGYIAFVVEYFSIHLPDIIISVSPHTTERLQNLLESKNVFTISNGVNYELIKSAKPTSKGTDILFVGRLLKHKRVDILIRTIDYLRKKIPAVECTIVGYGPEEKKLKTLCNKFKLNKNLRFIERIETEEELYSFMKASKIYILPSEREGFGITPLEAHACGMKVITVNSPSNAAADLVREFGHVVKPNEIDLSKKVLSIINDKSKISYSKKYNWDNVIHKFEKIYSV